MLVLFCPEIVPTIMPPQLLPTVACTPPAVAPMLLYSGMLTKVLYRRISRDAQTQTAEMNSCTSGTQAATLQMTLSVDSPLSNLPFSWHHANFTDAHSMFCGRPFDGPVEQILAANDVLDREQRACSKNTKYDLTTAVVKFSTKF